MIKITIESEDGYAGFLFAYEGVYEKPSTQRYNDIGALRKSLDELLEKIRSNALESRLVRNLHEMEDTSEHPSVREFARSALTSLGYASPTQ